MFRSKSTPKADRSLTPFQRKYSNVISTTNSAPNKSYDDGEDPLQELRQCINRMNSLVEETQQLIHFSSSSKDKKKKNKRKNGPSPFKNDMSPVVKSASSLSKEMQEKEHVVLPKTPDRKKVPTTHKKKKNRVNFIPCTSEDEEEMIELIRRIAELVVQGEKRSSKEQDIREGKGSITGDANAESNGEEKGEEKDEATFGLGSTNAIFEYFCEANVLSVFVNIVTGTAFSKPSTKNQDEKEPEEDKTDNDKDISSPGQEPILWLPPFSIATQAVQSMSILLQNVTRMTSLYFLLSNNRVNDLINLPLNMYTLAVEEEENEAADNVETPRKRGQSTSTPVRQRKGHGQNSAELAELTTHFISFLKSLAMRMNPETLQFFLGYSISKEMLPTATTDFVPDITSDDHVVNDDDDGDGKSHPKSSSLCMDLGTIRFPLYARALQFCSWEGDSFVRVTAMNICLNILQLITAVLEKEKAEDVDTEKRDEDDTDTVASNTSSNLQNNDMPVNNILAGTPGDNVTITNEEEEKASPPVETKNLMNGTLGDNGSVKIGDEKASPTIETKNVVHGTLGDNGIVTIEEEKVLPIVETKNVANGTLGDNGSVKIDGEDTSLPAVDIKTVTNGTLGADGTINIDKEEDSPLIETKKVANGTLGDNGTVDLDEDSATVQTKTVGNGILGDNGTVNLDGEDVDSPTVDTKHVANGSLVDDGTVNLDGDTTSSSIENAEEKHDLLASPPPKKEIPLQDRLAIAHYVCSPTNVQSLMAPIFMNLARLCGEIEGSVRLLDSSATTKAKTKATPKKLQRPTKQMAKVVSSIQDFIADMQDEFLLLEDVLKVGLAPLNEQVVEMMFATVVYPLLLQPLHVFMHQNLPLSRSESVGGGTTANKESVTEGPPLSPITSKSVLQDPFQEKPTVSASSVTESKEDLSAEDGATDKNAGEVLSPHPSTEPDPSLAKTALFVFAATFHLISHKPLLHLLITALFHPMTAEVSGDLILSGTPDIIEIPEDGRPVLRSDPNSQEKIRFYSLEKYFESSDDYTINLQDLIVQAKNAEKATFVLTPALAQIFQGTMSNAKPELFQMRANPYRRAILACLSGTDGMSALQNLATFAIDVVVSSSHNQVLQKVLFGANIDASWGRGEDDINDNDNDTESKGTKNADATSIELLKSNLRPSSSLQPSNNYMVEMIASMCVSVMTASLLANGVWSLKFSNVASHALLQVSLIDEGSKIIASKLIDHRRRQAASFLSQLPSRLNKNQENKASPDDAHRKNVMMDRVFFDPFCDNNKCIVEHIVREGEKNSNETLSGPGFISVAGESSIDDVSKQIFSHASSSGNTSMFRGKDDASYQCGANSTVAYLRLDSFSNLLREGIKVFTPDSSEGCSPVVALAKESKNMLEQEDGGNRQFFHTLSTDFSTLLFEEDVTRGNDSSNVPRPGSIVSLVGRTAFPCVCEVSTECDSLFQDRERCVVAEGIKWQSLYLVLLGKYMVLAEPARKDSGGNGRIITSCRLSRLNVDKDNIADTENASPARRLLLTHFSPDPTPPGVFIMDDPQAGNKQGMVSSSMEDYKEVRITKSSMDLWFEDSNAVEQAFKALCSKIAKARSKRGLRIREILAQDDKLRFSSFLSSG